MSATRWLDRLLRDLETLRRGDPDCRLVFGAQLHRYALRPPLDPRDVATFERAHKIKLPAEYRDFLTIAGNGGAGPWHGVNPLGEIDSSHGTTPWRVGEVVGSLCDPFPHRVAWNAPPHEIAAIFEAEDEARDELEHAYWRGRGGAIPISHRGCAIREWLVVSGPEAGRVWLDRLVDFAGWSPLSDGSGAHHTFGSWYRGWLDDALSKLSQR